MENTNSSRKFYILFLAVAFVTISLVSADINNVVNTNVGVDTHTSTGVNAGNANANVNADANSQTSASSSSSHGSSGSNSDSNIRSLTVAEISSDVFYDFGRSSSEIKDRIEKDSSYLKSEARSRSDASVSGMLIVEAGNGWYITDSGGNFASVLFVRQDYSVENNRTNKTFARGELSLMSDQRYSMRLNSSDENSMNFDLYDSNGNYAGYLHLDSTEHVGNFVVWKGNLVLESGTEYNLNIATTERAVRGSYNQTYMEDTYADSTGNSSGASRYSSADAGLWVRIKHFFGMG